MDNKFDVIDGVPALKRCRGCDTPISFMVEDVVETQQTFKVFESRVASGSMIRYFRNGHYEYQSTKQPRNTA